MNNIADIFYGILFQPVKTFRELPYSKPYKLPLFFVIFIAFFLIILTQRGFSFGTLLAFVSQAVCLILYWLFFAFFVDLIARMFHFDSAYSRLLTLTSCAMLPWIFLAPIVLLKNAGNIASDIASLLFLIIWVWTISLQVVAISETYSIPRKNAIIILLIPFLGMILYFIWAVDFFVKLFQISIL